MNKIKKYKELSKDIKNKNLNIDIENIKNGEYEIESIIDVFNDPKDIPIKENVIGIPANLSNKELKRNDIIWITAMVRKKGQSYSSPSSQAVLKLRVIDIYHGLQYLNKVIN